MKVVKLYRKPDEPEFYVLVRASGDDILVNYPTSKPYHLRNARWLNTKDIYIDWVRFYHD